MDEVYLMVAVRYKEQGQPYHKEAGQHHTSYQAMIRRLLDLGAQERGKN